MAKIPAFPTKLYVKQEQDGPDFYFVADRNRDDLVEKEPTIIAEYHLVNTMTAKLVPQNIGKENK